MAEKRVFRGWTDEELAKIGQPEEWAKHKVMDGPHYTVVGATEDCDKWPELVLPWRIAATGEEFDDLYGRPWARRPCQAAEKWARVRWDERYDGEGRLPITMRALVTHTDGRQWHVSVEIMHVIDCFGRATPVEPVSNADGLPGAPKDGPQ